MLLIVLGLGKYIEAFSKHQAANAVTLLGKLRGSNALLVRTSSTGKSVENDEKTRIEESQDDISNRQDAKFEQISVDLLEVGDIVRVFPGSTPPADGVIVSLEPTHFDESSLTGESRSVAKNTGDRVFVGTINKHRAVDIKVEAIDVGTMYVFHAISAIFSFKILLSG